MSHSVDFDQVQQIFSEARTLSGELREACLQRRCAGRAALRAEVQALLAAHDRNADSFLQTPVLESVGSAETTHPEIGTQFGQYTILDTLGRGGMGIVYRARQKGTQRAVALKIIRHERLSQSAVVRFEQEARVLGRLSDPGIAQVYEAGVQDGPDGRMPFIAMELVEGPDLLEATRGVSRRDCLALFIQVCDAVHHAHTKGIIHRDLKPDNILVSVSPTGSQPKVLDFGIARWLRGDEDAHARTLAGELIGTLTYMSPEQAAGDANDVDTRSDVYALGLVLYEMLTGRRPYDIEGLPLHEAVRVIHEQPPRPPAGIDPSLVGDLSTILDKALHKERSCRYPSAAELSADVSRHLDDQPIQARPPSRMYVLKKFARRNRPLVAAIVLGAAGLVLGTAIATWQAVSARAARLEEAEQRQRAEARFDDVRALANRFIFSIHDQLQDIPGTLAARKKLVETGQVYLDRLAVEHDDDARLQRDLVEAWVKIGNILGDPLRPSMGDVAGSLSSYGRALAIIEAVPAGRRDRYNGQEMLIHHRMGDVYHRSNRFDEALESYEMALKVGQLRGQLQPHDLRIQRELSVAHERCADALVAVGRNTEAQAAYAVARRTVDELLTLTPEDHELRRDVAVRSFRKGVSHLEQDRPQQALDAFRRFLELIDALAEADPNNGVYQRDLLTGYQRVGRAHAVLGQHDAARDAYRRVIGIGERMVIADPENVGARDDLCTTYCWLGELQEATGRHAAARHNYLRYVELADSAARAAPDSAAIQRNKGVSLYKLGEWYARRAEAGTAAEQLDSWQQARVWYDRAHRAFVDMQQRDLLTPDDAAVPADILNLVQQCDAAIHRLQPQTEPRPPESGEQLNPITTE